MIDQATNWTVVYLDGTAETVYGVLTVSEGVLWITERGPYGGRVEKQLAFPLASLRKWERA
jgi:hypothetical protein